MNAQPTTPSTPSSSPSSSPDDTSSSTPVRREQAASPALPGPVQSAEQLPDIDPPRDIGWMVVVLGALGVMFCSWTLFGVEANGMWGGYWATLLGTTALLGAAMLRSTLPRVPGLALTAACGAGLVLVGVVQGYGAFITVPLIAGGALIIAGVGLAASARR